MTSTTTLTTTPGGSATGGGGHDDAPDWAIEATGLVKNFGDTRALDGVDLRVKRGSVTAVLGPNGAGKTTAVRVLATLIAADEGSATVGGYDVAKQSVQVRERIGLTGQFASVDEDLTGTENLVLIGRLLDLSRSEAKARAAQLLAWFDLTEAAGRTAKTYSGGMRRRLDLAASLVGFPDVIFLDEPTTGLDPAKRDQMWEVVRRLVAGGATVLLTTQYLEEADALADDVLVMDHGRVIAQGTPEQLKRVVGGQTLSVRPSDVTRLAEVDEILRGVGTGSVEHPRPDVATISVADDRALTDVVARLSSVDITVTELSLHLPSLDEVFAMLTGSKPTDSDPDKEVAA